MSVLKRIVLVAFVMAGVVGLGSVGLTAAAAPDAARASTPVIVSVEGDAANGFSITYSDGSALYPPTDSEVMAECSEYDTRIERVKCRVKNRTWYRDLGQLKRSLAWARSH